MKYKILAINGDAVAEHKLGSGIYLAAIPKLRLQTDTMDVVEKDWQEFYRIKGTEMPSEFLENLSKCKLIEVELKVVSE